MDGSLHQLEASCPQRQPGGGGGGGGGWVERGGRGGGAQGVTSVDEVGLDLWRRFTSELLSAVHIFI